jgi:hypothetical protein
MATDSMCFPFLTCEVKCGNEALDIADRQNAHSASVAAKGMIELFQATKRERELHRKVIVFSISHDNRTVRGYGHYALILGGKISFWRHLIHKFSITAFDGKERWTVYRFTRHVYDSFVPIHLKRICSAIDSLADPVGFVVDLLTQQSPQLGNSFTSSMESFEISTPSSSQEIEPDTPSQNMEQMAEEPKAKRRRKGLYMEFGNDKGVRV